MRINKTQIFNNPIFKFLKLIYIYLSNRPYSPPQNDKDCRRILISYLTNPFRRFNDITYLNGHQNRREVLFLDSVLDSLNFNRKYIRFDCPSIIKKKFDVIFGLEPNFVKAANRNPKSLKIYYATGAYWKHQNRMIETRTKEFNIKHNSNIAFSRLIKPHIAVEIADYIIQIGSKFTIDTYPEELKKKIITIRQTCHNFSFENFIDRKLSEFKLTDFVWMGSGGTILKGLDLLIDYFLVHTDIKLHIVGPIDPDFMDVYGNIIKDRRNITIYGFLDLDSRLIEEIALKCAYVIFPSASEGCPGAVINMMKLGCIPIVSKYAAFDEIDEYGFIIKDFSLNAIDETIRNLNNMTKEDVSQKIRDVYSFANKNFNKMVFMEDMRKAFELILNSSSGSLK